MSLDLYWVIFNLLKSPAIWLTTVLALVVCILPYLAVQVFRNTVPARLLWSRSESSSTKVEFDNYGFDDGESIVNIRL
jgi:hypothetical protein